MRQFSPRSARRMNLPQEMYEHRAVRPSKTPLRAALCRYYLHEHMGSDLHNGLRRARLRGSRRWRMRGTNGRGSGRAGLIFPRISSGYGRNANTTRFSRFGLTRGTYLFLRHFG